MRKVWEIYLTIAFIIIKTIGCMKLLTIPTTLSILMHFSVISCRDRKDCAHCMHTFQITIVHFPKVHKSHTYMYIIILLGEHVLRCMDTADVYLLQLRTLLNHVDKVNSSCCSTSSYPTCSATTSTDSNEYSLHTTAAR